jgi:hypothetical protein
MLRTRADRLRAAVLTSLGLLPVACGAQVESIRDDGLQEALPTASPPDAPDEPSAVDTARNPPAPSENCQGSPVMAGDVNTSLVRCTNGVVHRPAAIECPNRLAQRAADASNVMPCDPDESCPQEGTCQTDADCAGVPYGSCQSFGQLARFDCVAGCVTDADCGAGEACVCGPVIGQCIQASCRTDDDCGGYQCAQFYDLFGIGCGEPMQLACQTPDDQCRSTSDCSAGDFGNCSAADGTWRCVEVPGIACGRPFLVEGHARLAPVDARGDYGTVLAPCLEGLDAVARARLSRAWLDVGRMEHASIAAFGRFCLQLLELGAPHALLVAAQAAMADETEHTRLAFALASHYAGMRLGPGALPMDGVWRESRLEHVLQLVWREGCVGETVAALEAAEALAHTHDPVVRSVLERIARDEQAHAELAWRFVAWALDKQPELASLVERELVVEAQAHRLPTGEAPPRRHAARVAGAFDPLPYGILTDTERAAVRAAAWRDVVQPCASRLLAQS